MPNHTPILSVIIPTYQRPAKLAIALASARAASRHPTELIVVDDCPNGTGFNVAREAGARYLHKAGRDQGQSVSRNIGLDLACGQAITFLDDDDQLRPGALDPLVDAALARGQLTFGNHALTVEDRIIKQVTLDGLQVEHLWVCNRIPVGSYVLPRAALSCRFDPRLRSHEDWDFLLAHVQSVGLHHIANEVVWIDQSISVGQGARYSVQPHRQKYFWLDFLSIYARFPAPQLAAERSAMLQRLGLVVPASMLQFDEVI